TTNDGSDTASASVEVLGAAIDVAKSADNASVSAGDARAEERRVGNDGTGIARNVALKDALPADAGTSWSIDGGTYATYTTCTMAGGTLRSEERRVGKECSSRGALYPPNTAAITGSPPSHTTPQDDATNDGPDPA